MRILVLYASFSGNTEEVAEIITSELERTGHSVVLTKKVPDDLTAYDLTFLGTFSWGKGRNPSATKQLVSALPIDLKVAVFGTGDTQFGKYYGGACYRLANYFASPFPVLITEQSPRGDAKQIDEIKQWTKGVLRLDRKINESKNAST